MLRVGEISADPSGNTRVISLLCRDQIVTPILGQKASS